MSYSSIQRAIQDQQLKDRVISASLQQALNNPTFGDTVFGQQVVANPYVAGDRLIGPVAIDYEDAYESALIAGRGAPGHDVDIITDANIEAAVQAHWPQDPA